MSSATRKRKSSNKSDGDSKLLRLTDAIEQSKQTTGERHPAHQVVQDTTCVSNNAVIKENQVAQDTKSVSNDAVSEENLNHELNSDSPDLNFFEPPLDLDETIELFAPFEKLSLE